MWLGLLPADTLQAVLLATEETRLCRDEYRMSNRVMSVPRRGVAEVCTMFNSLIGKLVVTTEEEMGMKVIGSEKQNSKNKLMFVWRKQHIDVYGVHAVEHQTIQQLYDNNNRTQTISVEWEDFFMKQLGIILSTKESQSMCYLDFSCNLNKVNNMLHIHASQDQLRTLQQVPRLAEITEFVEFLVATRVDMQMIGEGNNRSITRSYWQLHNVTSLVTAEMPHSPTNLNFFQIGLAQNEENDLMVRDMHKILRAIETLPVTTLTTVECQNVYAEVRHSTVDKLRQTNIKTQASVAKGVRDAVENLRWIHLSVRTLILSRILFKLIESTAKALWDGVEFPEFKQTLVRKLTAHVSDKLGVRQQLLDNINVNKYAGGTLKAMLLDTWNLVNLKSRQEAEASTSLLYKFGFIEQSGGGLP